jgi:hypothetical protein
MTLICALVLGLCEFEKKGKTKILAGKFTTFPVYPGHNSLEIHRV